MYRNVILIVPCIWDIEHHQSQKKSRNIADLFDYDVRAISVKKFDVSSTLKSFQSERRREIFSCVFQ